MITVSREVLVMRHLKSALCLLGDKQVALKVNSGRTQRDVEYAVDDKIFSDFDKAAAFAIQKALSKGAVTLDVIIYSELGAQAFGGDWAVKQYLEDPEASVFDRLEITINDQGRVP